mmetsp:Transcript_25868/g.74769  ORF Transcript_25868/g.74769 Transcript_25868/m.74769 type:complete len:262 (-) Transcript_25868:202-987(-)
MTSSLYLAASVASAVSSARAAPEAAAASLARALRPGAAARSGIQESTSPAVTRKVGIWSRSISSESRALRALRVPSRGSQRAAAEASRPRASRAEATSCGSFGGSTSRWSPARYPVSFGKRRLTCRTLRSPASWHSSRLASAASSATKRGAPAEESRPTFLAASPLALLRASVMLMMSPYTGPLPGPATDSSTNSCAPCSWSSGPSPPAPAAPPTACSSAPSQSSKSESKVAPSTSTAPRLCARWAPQRSRAASTSRGNCW